jgi:SAM-dependent methyltransferase
MPKTENFNQHADKYDNWFDVNKYVFQSELNALSKAFSVTENVIEAGIGSGIFAVPLGIKDGVEPSEAMRERAENKGLKPINGVAENLPYVNNSKNAVLMVTTICFVDDIYKSFQEVHRVLKDGGLFIIGFVDKNSTIGKSYLVNKDKSIFYKDAVFFGTKELLELLNNTGFITNNIYQTVFGKLDEITSVQNVLSGYGKGSFIVIKAQKYNEPSNK